MSSTPSTRTRIFLGKKKQADCEHGTVWTWLVAANVWWRRVDEGCPCPDPPAPS